VDVAVIGAGYVGLVTAGGLSHLGHRVRLGEVQAERVARLRAGEVPIFERGLESLLSSASERGKLSFHSSNKEAASGCEFIFLCLPTPRGANGRADLSFINGVVDELAAGAGEGSLFVIKSTVPPGTAVALRKRLADKGSQARIVSHPEFLREGRAVDDFLGPDRIVVGAFDASDARRVTDLYGTIDSPLVVTDPTSAEMIKYGSNSYLAARLTFANTLANLCEAVGADILDVIKGMGFDHRIGPYFLNPGPGYGGSCFPKDTAALIGVAEDAGYDYKLLKAVIEADADQGRRVVAKVAAAAGGSLNGRKIALWGLAFKAGTDDVRESPALKIAGWLQDQGADVVAYDPEARVDGIATASNPVEAARDADVVLVATEWPQFLSIDLAAVAKVMRGRGLVDARNLLDARMVRAAGLEYQGLGRPGV
jgi:UDPglucose 6-dehydrogenase